MMVRIYIVKRIILVFILASKVVPILYIFSLMFQKGKYGK